VLASLLSSVVVVTLLLRGGNQRPRTSSWHVTSQLSVPTATRRRRCCRRRHPAAAAVISSRRPINQASRGRDASDDKPRSSTLRAPRPAPSTDLLTWPANAISCLIASLVYHRPSRAAFARSGNTRVFSVHLYFRDLVNLSSSTDVSVSYLLRNPYLNLAVH